MGAPDPKRTDTAGNNATARGRPKDPLIGQVVAQKFRIRRLIGRGGMGNVYRADQEPLGRPVAIKVLSPTYPTDDDPGFVARFLREASAAAKLQHPNNITIYDFGSDGELLYIVMELLEGRTVRSIIRQEGPVLVGRTLHIVKQVCKALREAHQQGLVHRDVKPSNIFLVERDEDPDFVKVLDFGLVKFIDSESDLTKSGTFLGSPKYMSPEQIRKGNCDARSDVYSLGVLLYQMLSGKVPFEGDAVNILMAHLNDEPPALSGCVAGLKVPARLERTVMRCLEKDPAARFRSVEDVLDELRKVEEEQYGERSVSSRPIELSPSQILPVEIMAPDTIPTRSGGPARRGWVLPVIAIAVLAAIGFGTAGYLTLSDDPADWAGSNGDGDEDDEGSRRSSKRDRESNETAEARSASGAGATRDDRAGAETPDETLVLEVNLTSLPSGAEVHRKGERLGVTPLHTGLEVSREEMDDAFVFELRLPGYRPTELEATARDGLIVADARLVKIRKPPRPGTGRPTRPKTSSPGLDGYKDDPY